MRAHVCQVALRWAAAMIAIALDGCIQRTITVESAPAGALVWLNDEEVGRTPVTVPFTFYGTYDVRLEREGYETLHTAREAAAPWWELPGPDLLAEALPGVHEVNLRWRFELKERAPVEGELLLDHARQMRALMEQEPAGEGEDR